MTTHNCLIVEDEPLAAQVQNSRIPLSLQEKHLIYEY